MVTTSKVNCLILHALVILLYISSKFNATTLEQLLFSFNVEVDPANGGTCERNSGSDEESDGEPMLPKVIDGFRDAWLLSSAGVEMPPSQINARDDDDGTAVDFNRLRALLFIFFGIRINSAGQFDAQNQRAYNNMLGEFQAVDVLQTDPPDPFGYGEPKLWCLDDYSDFYTHMANDEGVEDESLPLAAVHFDQRYPGPNGGFLPGLLYAPKYDVYYRGPDDDPEAGFCDIRPYAHTKSISGPSTSLWGITLCESFFDLDDFASRPGDVGPEETSQSLVKTSGALLLAEMLVLVSTTGTKFQFAPEPDDGDWTSTDWSQWNIPEEESYPAVSLQDCVNLGLAKPSYARKNAYNYVHFALCVANDDLDCSSWLPRAALVSAVGGGRP